VNQQTVSDLASFYRRHLIEDVMAFWERHSLDEQYGGYLHFLDRTGQPFETTKITAFQARQMYMFRAMYNRVEPREQWLEAARLGYEFLTRHCHDGEGNWYQAMTREGKPRSGALYGFANQYVELGLSEYYRATGDEAVKELIWTTHEAGMQRILNPNPEEFYPEPYDPNEKKHAVSMMLVCLGYELEDIFPGQGIEQLVDEYLDWILNKHVRSDKQAVFESIATDGSFMDSEQGRHINPGHALESCWFFLQAARRRNDEQAIERILEIVDWIWPLAWDEEHGGIISYLRYGGGEPRPYGHLEAEGVEWADKIFWTNSEALIALAFAYEETGNSRYLEWFGQLHDWTQSHFYDPEYGEWYEFLHRDGSVKRANKGGRYKTGFHVPRALLNVWESFERVLRRSIGPDSPSYNSLLWWLL